MNHDGNREREDMHYADVVANSCAKGIKWNAPSFRMSEWFATFNLRATIGPHVILHLGAKVRGGPGITVDDPTRFLIWLGKDWASVTFRDADDVVTGRDSFADLIRRWIEHV